MNKLRFAEATIKMQSLARFMEYRCFDNENPADIELLQNKIWHIHVLLDQCKNTEKESTPSEE